MVQRSSYINYLKKKKEIINKIVTNINNLTLTLIHK